MIKYFQEIAMISNKNRVSVVIPVFNEEDKIADCLKAVFSQTIKPYEVIIVDNNSIDQTIKIAKNFKDVKIIREPLQGMIYARNAGFNCAQGSILARIDADTVLPKNWIETVISELNANPNIDGVSGYGRTRTGLTWGWASYVWSWCYFTHCKAFFGSEVLWGANMAIKREVWVKIKPLCLLASDIHEDQDISLAIASIGGHVKTLPDLKVSIDFNDNQYITKFWVYNRMKHKTRKLHKVHQRSRLDTYSKLSYPKRIFFHIISTYFVGIYMLLTALNSVARYLLIKLNISRVITELDG